MSFIHIKPLLTMGGHGGLWGAADGDLEGKLTFSTAPPPSAAFRCCPAGLGEPLIEF